MNYNKIAETLDLAAKNAKATTQISLENPMNLEEAYAIQSISLARRYVRGEKWVGLKLGFTSRAKMEQMGVHDMIWGRLTDAMWKENGGEIQLSAFIHPRAEPEIAFRFSKKVEELITLDNAKDYVDAVAIAIEIIDSRYENFKFSLEDVVADNCSSSAFVLGNWFDKDTEVNHLPIELLMDGKVVESGNTNAILGNPWESVVNASRLALDNGEILEKGSVLLAGAATSAIYLAAGQTVEVNAPGLGNVSFKAL